MVGNRVNVLARLRIGLGVGPAKQRGEKGNHASFDRPIGEHPHAHERNGVDQSLQSEVGFMASIRQGAKGLLRAPGWARQEKTAEPMLFVPTYFGGSHPTLVRERRRHAGHARVLPKSLEPQEI